MLLILKKDGKAYCKGIFVKDINSFFSYNFQAANLNPDRNDFFKFNDKSMANFALKFVEDCTIIKKLLGKVIEYYSELSEKGENNDRESSPYECNLAQDLIEEFQDTSEYNSYNRKYKAFLWRKAFEELFEQEILEKGFEGAVLKTDYEAPDYLNEALKKYKVINLPKDWGEALRLTGVRTDKEVIPDYVEEKIPTSLTLGYGAELWDTQRIILDSCQNHLPADSGGNSIFVRFQTTDGKWHDYRDFDKFQDSEIKRIKISDDGRGYDYKSLGLFASIKGHQESTGKWGEGLKMIAASAVRSGIKVELRSRNWMATPYTEEEVLNKGKTNEEEVQRLNFAVRIETKENLKTLDDGDNPENDTYGYAKKNEQSSTTFIDPTPELIKEFRNIRDSVLAFSTKPPLISLEDVDFLGFGKGRLYVKDILIPGEHQIRYSYHLKKFDIETRDRDAIRQDSMKSQIRKVLEGVENEVFIKMFLMEAANYAKKPEKKSFLEFETYYHIPSCTEKADLWIKAFQEYFGEDACVRKMSSQDYSEVAQAQHMGLDTITLPDSIANTLLSLEGRDGNKIPSYKDILNEAIENAIPVNENDLTPEEKAIVQQLYKYNKVLFLSSQTCNNITQINVYDYNPDYSGKKALGFAHFGNTVNISRDTLNMGLERATDVFLHEVGHAQTGAKDSEPEFRNYQTSLSAALITQVCPLEKSIIDNGLAKGIGFPRLKNVLKKLLWKIAVKDRTDIKVEYKEDMEAGDFNGRK